MVAFSDRPNRKVKLTAEARLASDLANAYLAGHLPQVGGWLDQDSYYVRLIDIALSIRTSRAVTAQRTKARRLKLRRRK